MKKLLSLALAGVLTVALIGGTGTPSVGAASSAAPETAANGGYREYHKAHTDAARPETAVAVDMTAAVGKDGAAVAWVENTDGSETAVHIEDGDAVTVTVDVAESGLYCVQVTYQTVTGKDVDLLYSLYIDGRLPFSSAAGLTLSRMWQDSDQAIFEDEAGSRGGARLAERFAVRQRRIPRRRL